VLGYGLRPNPTYTGSDHQLTASSTMAKLVFGMNQSLDGYVDHTAFGPSRALFRHTNSG
jgi:hypothetical protein